MEEVALLQGRLSLLQSPLQSSLEVAEVHRDDAGVYLCQLSNEHGEVEEVEAEISVLEEPARVVFSPRQVQLRLGEAGTVPCYIRQAAHSSSELERLLRSLMSCRRNALLYGII